MDGTKHSGFEAPIYGEAFPAGSFQKGPDGYLVLTLIGAYSKVQKLLGNIYYCIEYDSAYRFVSRNNNTDSKAKECIILKETASEVDWEFFASKYCEVPVRFYSINNEGDIADRTSDVDLNNIDFTDLPMFSGYDAPVRGKQYPKGTIFKKDKDGYVTPILPDSEDNIEKSDD